MFAPLDVLTTDCVKKQKKGEKVSQHLLRHKSVFPVNSKAVFLINNFVNNAHHVFIKLISHSFNPL